MDVIDLNERRRDSEQPGPDYVTCGCGDAALRELREARHFAAARNVIGVPSPAGASRVRLASVRPHP
jgi:hypothetical protein